MPSSSVEYRRIPLICRSGPRKPKLENLAVNQWSVANITILHKLVQDGTLPLSQVFDYMSYTTYLYRLMNAYDSVSVYIFDREYRRLQHAHKFRWGTVVGHLSTQHLRLRQSKENVGNTTRTSRQSNAYNSGNQSKLTSHSLDGKPICRKFNPFRLSYVCIRTKSQTVATPVRIYTYRLCDRNMGLYRRLTNTLRYHHTRCSRASGLLASISQHAYQVYSELSAVIGEFGKLRLSDQVQFIAWHGIQRRMIWIFCHESEFSG